MTPRWIPGELEEDDDENDNGGRLQHNNLYNETIDETIFVDEDGNEIQHHHHQVRPIVRHRGIRRRLFLFLTEPQSSLGSAAFFFILIIAIFVSNAIMIMQTMDYFQYTPGNCHICGGDSRVHVR